MSGKGLSSFLCLLAPTVLRVGTRIEEFLASIPDYPFQEGSTLSASNINYLTLKAGAALQRLQEIETHMPARN